MVQILIFVLDVEWISPKQFLAADVNGIITLDTLEPSHFISVKIQSIVKVFV